MRWKARRLPSGENENGASVNLLSVRRTASPEPSEWTQYIPGLLLFVDAKTMFRPSGVHTGKRLVPVRKLRREGVSRSKSFTQMSSTDPAVSVKARRLPSGESRGEK